MTPPKVPGASRFRFPWKTKQQIAAEIDEEFAFHLQSRAEELEQSGIPADQARRQALAEFGDARRASAYCRRLDRESERSFRWNGRWSELRLDLIYLLRSLRRAPATPATIIIILGVGLAINLLAFTLANELLFRQLPVADQRSLVLVHGESRSSHAEIATSIPDYQDLSREARVATGLAGFNGRSFALTTDGAARVVSGQIVTSNYFAVLGLVPAAGRFFAPDDDQAGTARTAVISHRLWRDGFRADPAAVGTPIRLNGQTVTIVGVAPQRFAGPFIGFQFDLFVPLGTAAGLDPTVELDNRATRFLELFGRLSSEGSLEAAAELTSLAQPLNGAVPAHHDRIFRLAPLTGLDTELRPGVVLLLTLLLALAGLGLFAASLNAGGLLHAIAVGRQKEFALRLALGAGRMRLIRLLLLEVALLGLAAAGLGVAIALGVRRLAHLAVPGLPLQLSFDLAFDGRVIAVLVALVGLTVLSTGLLPAMAATRSDFGERLRTGSSSGPRESRLRQAFLAGQIAITFALLVGAGLLARTLLTRRSADQSATTGIATMLVDLSFGNHRNATRGVFFGNLEARVRAIPGVESAGYAAQLPFGFGLAQAIVQVPGMVPPTGESGFRVEANRVSAGWLETVGLPLVHGRGFNLSDRALSRTVVMVNRVMADRFWPSSIATSQSLSVEGVQVEVVGVIDDSRLTPPGRPPRPRVYRSFDQGAASRAVLLVRGPAVGQSLAGLLAATLRDLDPDLPANPVRTLDDNVRLAFLPQRMLGGATAALAALTLMLAAVGLYGLLAHWVAARRVELGIRAALGARSGSIAGLTLRQGLGPIVLGMVVGFGLAVAIGFGLRAFLVGVSPIDPFAYLTAAAAFLATATAACLIPAWRAGQLSPIGALRGGS